MAKKINFSKLFSGFFIVVLFCSFSFFLVNISLLPSVKASHPDNLVPFDPYVVYPTLPAWLSYDYVVPLGEPYTSDRANIRIDPVVTYAGSPSLRIDGMLMDGGTGIMVESDGGGVDGVIAVTPGDVIFFSCWMKTTADSLGMPNSPASGIHSGARIGIDYYDAGYIGGQAYDGAYTFTPTLQQLCDNNVPFNTPAWTYREITTTVPNTVYDVDGNPHTPGFIIPWMQQDAFINDLASCYFADPVVLLNPGVVPTPTPTSTAAPTPTPSPTASPNPFSATNFLITEQPFIINYSSGNSFQIQSLDPLSTITFSITSGLMNGTGSVNASNAGGTFRIDSSTNGTLLITSTGEPVSVYIDGVYANNIPYDFYPGDPLITWTYGSTVIINNNGIQYYFRSDTYSTLSVSGYGFDSDYTNTVHSVNETYAGTEDVTYGYQVFLFNSPTIYTELTSGPSATVTVSGNYTGQINSTLNMAEHAVTLGYQGLQINVLERFGTGAWVTIANFISPVLITNSIEASTWQFLLQIEQLTLDSTNSTSAKFIFGDTNYRSGINNILLSTPNESDIQAWRIGRLDFVGFILATYMDEIGTAFYALLLLLFAGTLYFRYGHFGVVSFFFVLFGGVGGLLFLILPLWAAGVTGAFIILGTTFLVWRIIR